MNKKKAYKMDFKTFWKTTNTAFIIKNLLAALVVAILLLVIILTWLRRYTEHGVEVEIPQVTGLYQQEAQMMLEAEGLRMVVVDSTYSRKVPLGTIVEQNPRATTHAKHDRAVYVIINASTRRQVPLPDLHDISYRQAEATLKSLGIQVKEILYEPSEYKDLILDIRMGDNSLEAGTRIDEGSSVTLIVGRGAGTEMVAIPNLQGRTLSEARSLLLSQYLTLGSVTYDEEVTDENRELFIIYQQDPTSGSLILEGSHVDIRLSTSLEKAIMTDNTYTDEDFF